MCCSEAARALSLADGGPLCELELAPIMLGACKAVSANFGLHGRS